MGNYLTSDNFRERLSEADLIQLTDDDGVGELNDAVLAGVIATAEADVDSYLSTRYLTPVDVSTSAGVAAMLKSRALDLAVYGLYLRRGNLPEQVATVRDNCIAWLRDVSAGRVALGLPMPAESSSSPTSGRVAYGGSDRKANRLTGL